MDTNSKNNQNQPKSWEQLASNASKATPPDDLNILEGVQRAIAAEQWTPPTSEPEAKPSWLDEIAGIFDQKWAIAGLGAVAITVVSFGYTALTASQEASLIFDLSAWINPL